ncbi:hypothetical protein D9M72_642290 [compost metagenome]
MAWGLCCAWAAAATLIQASCSEVVPNSCMWRAAARAYMFTVTGLYGISQGTSGVDAVTRRWPTPTPLPPSVRGRPASVISATLHLPAAMACAACATWIRYAEPPVSVLSMWRSRVRPR